MTKPFAMFGYSHLFGDIVDCIDSVDGRLEAEAAGLVEERRAARVDERIHLRVGLLEVLLG